MNDTTSTKEHILADIKSGRVHMLPRAYYVAQTVLIAIVALVVLALSMFIVGFIFFSIRVNGHDALLGFGFRGIGMFLLMLPWVAITVDILLIILLRSLMQRFQIGYRTPALYATMSILVCAVGVGFAIDHETDLHDRMFERSERLPRPLRALYQNVRQPRTQESGICHCIVIAREGATILLQDVRGTSSTAIQASISSDSDIEVGDTVYIAGDEKKGVISPFGVYRTERQYEHTSRYWLR